MEQLHNPIKHVPQTLEIGCNIGKHCLYYASAGLTRKPNRDILEHDRKRQIELKLVELEDQLTDEGCTDAEITKRLDEERKILDAAATAATSAFSQEGGNITNNK